MAQIKLKQIEDLTPFVVIQQDSGSGSTVRINNGNTASGTFSTVGGGGYNTASGECSGILGGISNHTCGFANVFIVGSNICATANCTTFVNRLAIMDIATSSVGLTAGALWNDSGTLKIVL